MAIPVLSNFHLTDDTQIRLGDATNGDLQIYHDGSDSYIREYGAVGDLKITAEANAVEINKLSSDDTGNNMGRFVVGGAVELYHNGSKKFETTGSGATVTGSVTATTFNGGLNGNVSGNVNGNLINGTVTNVSTLTTTSGSTTNINGVLNFQKTGFTTITGSSNTFNINFATVTNNYQFTLDNAACTISFGNLSANVVGKSGNIIITNPSSVGSLSVGNLPSEAYSPGGATVSWDTNASSVSILSYFILASDKVLINYVGNFKSYGT